MATARALARGPAARSAPQRHTTSSMPSHLLAGPASLCPRLVPAPRRPSICSAGPRSHTPTPMAATPLQHQHHHHQQHVSTSSSSNPPATSALHPTLSLLQSRMQSGSQPGARTDGARLGLVVEGGGMQGVISGSMLMALRDLGLTHAFDAVYGSSAGAINATYFLTGQEQGLHIYTEDLTQGTRFMDFRNLLAPHDGGRPVMNLSYLVDHVMHQVKPLDWEGVLASPVPLKVVASCLDSLRPVTLSDFSCRKELAEALKASANVPRFAGPPRRLRGRTLVDAAVFEPVPTPSAIRDGCTHVLVLCTRPAPEPAAAAAAAGSSPLAAKAYDMLVELIKGTVLNAPYMGNAWSTPQAREDPVRHDAELLAARDGCPYAVRQQLGAFVMPVYPEHSAGCNPICLDRETLTAGMDVGRRSLLRALEPVVSLARQGGTDVAAVAAAAAAEGQRVRARQQREEWRVEEEQQGRLGRYGSGAFEELAVLG